MADDLSGGEERLSEIAGDRDVSWMEGVWHQRDVTPSEIADALRDLLRRRHAESESYVPARVLNLVVICDRDWRGEIQNRLENVGRYHASRTILCCVEPGRKSLDALATMTVSGDPRPGEIALCHEEVVVDIGPQHLPNLDTIVDPLVVSDLATVVWSPHGYPEAVDSVRHLSQVVLVDSVNEPDAHTAIARAHELSTDSYVVDLAWLRSTPWRERVAATFDPPLWRQELAKISTVTSATSPARSSQGCCSSAGWRRGSAGSRARWSPRAARCTGTPHGHRQDVDLCLEPDETMSTPGLAGMHIETASGMSIALDRGAGGLQRARAARATVPRASGP